MKTHATLCWLELRLLRRDLLVAVLLCTLLPLVPRLSGYPEAAAAALHFFLLPLCGGLLGCTLASPEHSPAFLKARPADWDGSVALRLTLRTGIALLLWALSGSACWRSMRHFTG